MKKFRSQAFPAKVDIKSGVTHPPRVEIVSEEELRKMFKRDLPQLKELYKAMFGKEPNI